MEEKLGNIVQFDLEKGIPGEIVGTLADGSLTAKCASVPVWLDTVIREWVETCGVPGCAYQFVAPEGASQHYYCVSKGVAKLILRSR